MNSDPIMLGGLLREVGITVDTIRAQYSGMDETYALTTDLTDPLLFVPHGEAVVLIDGWHRLTRAALCGVDILPAYFLTQEEADLILLGKFPNEVDLTTLRLF